MAASSKLLTAAPSRKTQPGQSRKAHAVGDLAKLSRPRLYDALARERLFSRLDELRRHPVVWIAGPPGAGKTTLVASYLEARKHRGIWYQLDAGDADVSTFFFYLSEAAKALAPRKSALPLLTPEYLFDLSGFARRYFRELLARLPQHGSLVLDNFQEIVNDSLFHQAVIAAFSEIPVGRNLVIISRAEPSADYTRGIASGELAHLSWAELRFSLAETRAISDAHHKLTDSVVRSLHDCSDGWAAGLVLMLERADLEAPEDKTIGLASREAVFDYFASIFFNQVSLAAQRILMLAATVPTLTAAAALEITGDESAAPLLDDLYRRQLFVQRLHGSAPAYRFHSLFRAFLQTKAQKLLPLTEIDSARLRAAKAMEAAGDIEQAFALYAVSEQWAEVARIVLQHAQPLFAAGRWKTLMDWIGRLPTAEVRSDPWLAYWLGVSQFQIDQELSRATLTGAFEQFESSADELGQMLTAASILTGYYFEYANWENAEPWIFRLGHLLESHPTFPSRELELTVYSAMLYGIAIRRPDHPMLPVCIERTVALIEQDLETNARMQGGLAITGPVVCMLGAFDLFYRVRKMLLPLLEDKNLTELNRVVWHMTNGTKLCLNADHEDTYVELERGAVLGAQYNMRQLEFLCHFFASMHAACYFDIERARTSMEALQRVVNPARPLERAHQLWCEGMYETIIGNFAAGVERHKAALVAAEAIGGAAHKLVDFVLQCAPLVLSGRVTEAAALAEEGLRFARECKVRTWDASFVLVLAWCRYEQGDQREADRLLEQALDVGDDGTYRYFRWLLQGCRKMLSVALQRGIRTESVLKIVRHFRYTAPDPLQENWPWPVKVRALGKFEIEVGGQPLRFGRKTPKRLLSLLQYVVALGGRDVSEHRITDALWPDADGDEAHRCLNLSLHRLRQLLGDMEAIRFSGGKVSLNSERVWVDALCMNNARDQRDPAESQAIAMSVYRGEFLESEPEAAWMFPMRARLRQLHNDAIRGLSITTQSEIKKKVPSL